MQRASEEKPALYCSFIIRQKLEINFLYDSIDALDDSYMTPCAISLWNCSWNYFLYSVICLFSWMHWFLISNNFSIDFCSSNKCSFTSFHICSWWNCPSLSLHLWSWYLLWIASDVGSTATGISIATDQRRLIKDKQLPKGIHY